MVIERLMVLGSLMVFKRVALHASVAVFLERLLHENRLLINGMVSFGHEPFPQAGTAAPAADFMMWDAFDIRGASRQIGLGGIGIAHQLHNRLATGRLAAV